jgi:hypothetical protein
MQAKKSALMWVSRRLFSSFFFSCKDTRTGFLHGILPLDQARPSTEQLLSVLGQTPQIGEAIAIGCAPAGTAGHYISCPPGFESKGETGNPECNYCSLNPGTAALESAGCTQGSCSIVGHRILCAYEGSQPSEAALGEKECPQERPQRVERKSPSMRKSRRGSRRDAVV